MRYPVKITTSTVKVVLILSLTALTIGTIQRYSSTRKSTRRSLQSQSQPLPPKVYLQPQQLGPSQNAIAPPGQNEAHPEIRHAILHVGPPKTASTTIQTALTRDTNVFKEDRYFVKGPFEELVNCMKVDDRSKSKCPPAERQSVNAILADAAANYDHLVISSEGFGDEGSDLNLLAQTLSPWNDVTVIIGYRRLFEWLPSKYHQYHRKYTHYWNWLGRDLFPSQKEFLTKEKILFYVNVRFVPRLMQFYGEKFPNIKLFNLHNLSEGDVVPEFYCTLPDAPRSCEVAIKRTEKRERKGIKVNWNPSLEEIDYIRLVRAAAEKGFLKNEVDLKEAVDAARQRHESELGLTVRDFPRECMDVETLEFLLNLSIDTERKLFPEWFARPGGEEDIRAAFNNAAQTKLCNPDVHTVLLDDGWQVFFKSMNGPSVSQ